VRPGETNDTWKGAKAKSAEGRMNAAWWRVAERWIMDLMTAGVRWGGEASEAAEAEWVTFATRHSASGAWRDVAEAAAERCWARAACASKGAREAEVAEAAEEDMREGGRGREGRKGEEKRETGAQHKKSERRCRKVRRRNRLNRQRVAGAGEKRETGKKSGDTHGRDGEAHGTKITTARRPGGVLDIRG